MEEVHRGGSKNKGAWPVGLGKGYRGRGKCEISVQFLTFSCRKFYDLMNKSRA